MKKYRFWLIIYSFILSIVLLTMVGCTNSANSKDNIDHIFIDDEITEINGFNLETFDISQIEINIKYKDTLDADGNVTEEGIIEKVPLSLSYVKAEDKQYLTKLGIHNITIYYNGFTITFKLRLYSNEITDETLFIVNFYKQDGRTLISQVSVKPNGRAIPPTNLDKVENMEFVGWVDLNSSKAVNLNNVTSNLNVRAQYEEVSYKVSFLVDNESIKDVIVNNGESIKETDYPDAPSKDGYTFISWNMVDKKRYSAVYQKNQYDITFVYRKYSNNRYSNDTITTTIKYDHDATQITEIDGAKSNGISPNNDFQFIGWYTESNNGDKVKVEFPFNMDNGIYEITFYADYVSFSTGSENLLYQNSVDGLILTDYLGDEEIVVIPNLATITVSGEQIRKPVYQIKEGVFKNKNIKEYIVASDNPYFVSENGVLYNKDKSVLLLYPNNNLVKEVKVIDSVVEIGSYAFSNNKEITNIIFPNELKTIDSYAFTNCYNLLNIEFPESLEIIDTGAFLMEKDNLLSEIHFNGTEITTIKDYAFAGLNSLETIELPSSLNTLGSAVFKGCTSLYNINSENNSYFSSFEGALYTNDFLTLIAYPSFFEFTNPILNINENCSRILLGAFNKSRIAGINISSKNLIFEPDSFDVDCLKVLIYLDNSSIDGITDYQSMFNLAFGSNPPKSIYYYENLSDQFNNVELNDVDKIEFNTLNNDIKLFNNYVFTTDEKNVATIIGYSGRESDLNIVSTLGENGEYSVQKIGDYAFSYNPYIETVTLPVSISEIGVYSFSNCNNLRTVNLAQNSASILKRIGEYAFLNSKKLEIINVSELFTLESLGRYCFNGTAFLDNATSSIILGGIYIKYIGNDSIVSVPSNVVYIASDAFKDASSITSITFNTNSTDTKIIGLTTIDSYAFMNCKGLTSINYPITLKKINDNAFYGCEYLYKVTYLTNKDVVDVSTDAYYEAGTYYEENKVYEIFEDTRKYTLTFYVSESDITEQRGISFEQGITPELTTAEIFLGWCTDDTKSQIVKFPISIDKDTTIYANIKDSSYSSDGFTFVYNESTDSYEISGYNGIDEYVAVPERYYDKLVTGVLDNVFNSNILDFYVRKTTNTDGSIISNLTHVKKSAFEKTYWYNKFPGDYVYLDNILIGYKGNSRNVVLPNNLTLLSDGAFKGNSRIESVTIPEGVTVLPKDLFRDCINLKTVYLPSSISKIEETVFYNCYNLVNINFNDANKLDSISADALTNTKWISNQKDDCIVINDILFKYVGTSEKIHIPSTIRTIGIRAFEGNNKIKEIYINKSLNLINDYAFKDCTNLTGVYFLSEETSLNSINKNAFYNCTALSEIDLSKTKLLYIGEYTFYGTTSLKDIVIPKSVANLGKYAFALSNISSFEINDTNLTSLSPYLFYNCGNLNSVIFTGTCSINEISEFCFANCSNLITFRIASNSNRIKKLDNSCFYDCKNLINLSINESSIEVIENNALYNLGYIESNNDNQIIFGKIFIKYRGNEEEITIPADISVIYNKAFENNTDIRRIKFASNSNLTSINDDAFNGCINLEEINIPSSVNYIGYNVFNNTTWLKNKTLENEFLVVNGMLVKYTSNIVKQVVIPSNVNTIIKGAFEGTSVYDILIEDNITLIYDGAFINIIPVSYDDETNTYPEYTLNNENGSNNENNNDSKLGFTLTINNPVPPEIRYTEAIKYCTDILFISDDVRNNYQVDLSWQIQQNSIKYLTQRKYLVKYNISSVEAYTKRDENIYAFYSEIDIQSKDNFKFTGWFYDSDCTQPLEYPLFLNGSLEIYAKLVDLTQGSNPESFYLEDDVNSPGNYTIISYNPTYEDTSVVIISKQAGKNIVSITGHLGYKPVNVNDPQQKYIYINGKFEIYDESDTTIDQSLEKYVRNMVIKEISFANNSKIAIFGENCFAGFVNLQKITFPDSTKIIKEYAFADCDALNEVIFDSDIDGLELLSNAFVNCFNLERIVLPEKLKTLEDNVFVNCLNLKEIVCLSSTPINLYGDNKTPFGDPNDLPEDFKIIIPKNSINSYKSFWDKYSDYFVETED